MGRLGQAAQFMQSAGRVASVKGLELVIPNPKLKLMDQVREVMRVKHYAIRTEQAYCDWIRRYIKFHRMLARAELFPAEGKIELFLSDLAVNGNVAVSTQNQAFNALLFLYREVLHQPFEKVQAVRADRPVRVPVVLTAEEVKRVLQGMSGTAQLVAKVLYGSGLRLLEALRLRVQDLDFQMKQITVRDAEGRRMGPRCCRAASCRGFGSTWRGCGCGTRRTFGRATHVLQQDGQGVPSRWMT